jgi:CubicO group peptidase (beta-lactamase class C family)
MNRLRIPAAASFLAVAMGFMVSCSDMPTGPVDVTPELGLQGFEAELDSIRVALRIPGMAAAIAKDGEIVWSRGFGLADVDQGRPATDTTSFYLASVTKSIAAIVIMQLVQEGLLDLDTSISEFGLSVESQGTVTVRHIFNHTSEGVPGTAHRYSGNRYILMGDIAEQVSGRSFAQLLQERILGPLNLRHTAPDVSVIPAFLQAGLNRHTFMANMAMPYELENGKVIRSEFPSHFSPSAGLMGSVRDIAAISIGLDQDRFLNPATKGVMLSPTITMPGENLNYGLGWFVQWHEGIKIEWHGGEWNSQSALLLRVPDRNLTLVAVANTRRMSGAYRMGLGDVMESGVGRLFVESFVLGDEPLPVGSSAGR